MTSWQISGADAISKLNGAGRDGQSMSEGDEVEGRWRLVSFQKLEPSFPRGSMDALAHPISLTPSVLGDAGLQCQAGSPGLSALNLDTCSTKEDT